MTDPRAGVVIPYSRFLECQDRRRTIVVELTRRDLPPTPDADGKPRAAEASAQPLIGAETS